MRILVTDGQSLLGAALVRTLAQHHEVRTPTGPGDDLRDRETAARLTSGCEVIIHTPLLDVSQPLQALDQATRATYNLLTTATGLRRFILLSTLATFERYPAQWRVNEYWAPRPTTAVSDLAPYLAELTVREIARCSPLVAVALRLGQVVEAAGTAADPRHLHLEDAVTAVERALIFSPPADGPAHGWWVYHIVAAGQATRFPIGMAAQEPFNFAPRHQLTDDRTLLDSASPRADEPVTRLTDQPGGRARRVVIFGAGGPLAAITTEWLANDHLLRLTDARPLAKIVAAGNAQSPGAPLPRLLEAPHESWVTDVTDQAAVSAAAAGMDAIINCTVMRPHPVEAFRVNTLGAYTVMRAAVEHGIRRVVHTGPQQVTFGAPAGYWYDFGLGDDLPPRPGDHLYILTKFLGQEICRIFAEEHALEVPTLLFSSFVNPSTPAPEPLGAFPFSVSWEDAAAAMRLALRLPSLPHPFEVFHILGDLPHGKYSNEKAKRLLGWQPRDRLEAHWTRPSPP